MQTKGIVLIVCLAWAVHDASADIKNFFKSMGQKMKGGKTPANEAQGETVQIVFDEKNPDWSGGAKVGVHLWQPTKSGICIKDELNWFFSCSKKETLLKCSACKLVAHASCFKENSKKFPCRASFYETGVQLYEHHWVSREKGYDKCKKCNKYIIPNLLIKSTKLLAKTCAWCETSYHNKKPCFDEKTIDKRCDLGDHKNIIVPPSWITKKSGASSDAVGSFAFVINPVQPTDVTTPLLVFVNLQSGGKQGDNVLKELRWLLNPRQVFDLSQGGPRLGLELYRNVPKLRILVCGGDGSNAWVMKVLDEMNLPVGTMPLIQPAIGTLPLGNENDLSRTLGWGGAYTGGKLSPILKEIAKASEINLDRWNIKVESNEEPDAVNVKETDAKDKLNAKFFSNCFVIGADADLSLKFHEARNGGEFRFDSRLYNKAYYAKNAVKDLWQKKWKHLSQVVTLYCGENRNNITSKLIDHGVHTVGLLNIPNYSGGTKPWNEKSCAGKQSFIDGKIEIIGLTTSQFLWINTVGKHAPCIDQCESVHIVTKQPIPVHVDGEPVKLNPSIITITHDGHVKVLQKKQ